MSNRPVSHEERRRPRRGLTGLETAIILIAFVITAAAFAFAVLNVGFQTTQQAQSVVRAGTEEASSAIELDGAVIAEDPDGDDKAELLKFTIRMSTGRIPIDLRSGAQGGTLVITYQNDRLFNENIYDGTTVTITQIVGDGDNLLEFGEKFLVEVNLTAIDAAAELGPNEGFRIELKPAAGAVLVVERKMPPSIDPVMFLG